MQIHHKLFLIVSSSAKVFCKELIEDFCEEERQKSAETFRMQILNENENFVRKSPQGREWHEVTQKWSTSFSIY